MPGRRNYEKAVRRACAEIKQLTGDSPLEYISRPGGGEPPRYVFLTKTCLGGPEALHYVEGLVEAAHLVVAERRGDFDA